MPKRTMESKRRGIMPGLIFVSREPDFSRTPSEVGIISGSFDPPTNAHLALAEALRLEGCNLVLLLYSVKTLPKEESPHVPGGSAEPPLLDHSERAACLATLAAGRSWLAAAVCVENLLEEQAQLVAEFFPSARLSFGVGSDKLIQIFDPSWYRDREASLERLFRTATIRYAARNGESEELQRTLGANTEFGSHLHEITLPIEVASISSREIRRKIFNGGPPEGVPEEVQSIVMSVANAER